MYCKKSWTDRPKQIVYHSKVGLSQRASGTGMQNRVSSVETPWETLMFDIKFAHCHHSLFKALLLSTYPVRLEGDPHNVLLSDSCAHSVALSPTRTQCFCSRQWNICALDFHIIMLPSTPRSQRLPWIYRPVFNLDPLVCLMCPSRFGCACATYSFCAGQWCMACVQNVVGCRSYQVGFAALSAGTSGCKSSKPHAQTCHANH